jgi:hypothetical protein
VLTAGLQGYGELLIEVIRDLIQLLLRHLSPRRSLLCTMPDSITKSPDFAGHGPRQTQRLKW